jgi:hypothetical protein
MTNAFYMSKMLRDRSAVAGGSESLSRSAPVDI